MNSTAPHERSAAVVYLTLALALSISLPGRSAADSYIICSDITDSDRTRAVVEMGSSVSGLEIVTPEYAWTDPDSPQGKTDVSPNLVGRKGVYVTPLFDSKGQLRILDFGVRAPEALELEGLRGSLAFHEVFLNDRAFASLFYAGTGNLVSITSLVCEQIDGP